MSLAVPRGVFTVLAAIILRVHAGRILLVTSALVGYSEGPC